MSGVRVTPAGTTWRTGSALLGESVAEPACTEVADPSIFYPDQRAWVGYREALKVCATCPAWKECLVTALRAEGEAHERWGMWGGRTPRQRRTLSRDMVAGITPRVRTPAAMLTALDRFLGHGVRDEAVTRQAETEVAA